MESIEWHRGLNEFKQPIWEGARHGYEYTIDGNGYGKMKWVVSYPNGDHGITESLKEAKAWAEVDLTRRIRKMATRKKATEAEVVPVELIKWTPATNGNGRRVLVGASEAGRYMITHGGGRLVFPDGHDVEFEGDGGGDPYTPAMHAAETDLIEFLTKRGVTNDETVDE